MHIKNIPGPDSIDRKTLPNGITLLTFENFNTYSVDLFGLLDIGSATDPNEKLGLTHFTASMLTRGTHSTPFAKYHDLLESRGANLSFSCGTRHTWFRGKGLAEDLELLARLSAESLREPSFPAEYVERLRSQLLTGLAIRDQDTSEMASLLFDHALFPGHPYGNPVDGFTHTIQAITRADLLKHHMETMRPEGMVLVVAGAVRSGEVSRLAEKHFGDWQNKEAMDFTFPPVPPAPQGAVRRHRYVEEKSQTDLEIGARGPARNSEEYLPAYVGNNILGQFGLMGRIGESVRSKSGLAYHASSSLNGWQDAGAWEFSAGLSPQNLDKVIDLIRAEIGRFIKRPVSAEELADSKSHLIGRMPLSLESNSGIANAILTIERFDLGMDYYQRYPTLIQAITAEQILEAARKYLHPDHLVIASAGEGEDIV